MYFKEEIITLEKANELLENNPLNRRLNVKRVQKYARAMRDGEWTSSPNPISVSKDGTLLDGQHRLRAVLSYGKPIKCIVAYDVPSDAVIDKGLERATGDSLYMRGLIAKDMSKKPIIAIINCYYEMLGKFIVDDRTITNFINKHEDDIKKVWSMSRLGERKNRKICCRAGVQAALLGAVLCGCSIEKLEHFTYVANTGFLDDKIDNTAILLRNEILDTAFTGRAKITHICLFAQSAIFDYMRGIERKRRYYKEMENIYIKLDSNDIDITQGE